MKQALFAGTLLLLFSFSFAQVNSSYKFGTTGSNVIVYKQGTSCTASAYSFYLIDDAGIQAATPFYTLTNTSREVNGIGINPVDRFLYGVEYDRDASCAFSNFHLKRYDTQGGSDDLGALPAPAGGSVTAAVGCITNNGSFVYSAKDASGNNCVCTIINLSGLPANAAGSLALASAKQITNNASNYSYADWAVHPTNGNIYTYGIANIGGVSTGKLLALDPATGILQSVGAADGSNFLDPARDNFGGVYFGSNLSLYGVNVNTRKLYKIDVVSGAATYVSTVSGSGQIRADMGSYTTGWTVLPVAFTKVEIAPKNERLFLRWSVANSNDVKEFLVEQNTGNGFEAIDRIASDNSTVEFSAAIASQMSAQYRVKAIGGDGKIIYSSIVMNTTKETGSLKIIANPVQDGVLHFISTATTNASFLIFGSSGQVLKTGNIACTKGLAATIAVNELKNGIYIMQISNTPAVRFVVD